MRNPRMVLITLMLATSMAAIDSSIVNVSLPVIRDQFKVAIDEVEWVITAYMVSFCLFIPLIGWLKKKIGYFTLFLISVAVFTAGSLLCSLSSSLGMLVVARIIQASGGGAISPTSLAILSESFPKERRGSAIGWWGIGNVMGPALGPTLGGVLTHYFGWQSVFYVNIPIGIAVVLLSLRYLTYLKEQPRTNPKFDVAGYFYFSLFIVTVQYTISLVSKNAGLSWKLVSGIVVMGLAFYAFLRGSRKEDALLDLGVFRSGVFVNAAVIVMIRSLALYGGMFFLPFLLALAEHFALQDGFVIAGCAIFLAILPAWKLPELSKTKHQAIA